MIPEKQKILIVDDSEMNRAILTGILDDGYDFLEAENGLQALDVLRAHRDISLVLLDIVMPVLDGFGVLSIMGEQRLIDQTPVIMISAESDSMLVERAYQLGATDYISRPFDKSVVRRRVINTLMLYGKQKHLMRMITEQVYKREKSNLLMTGILSHIVEFRNAESGLHVQHIQTVSELLLRQLARKTDRYALTEDDIALISTASALHDIGKISIPDSILNKPGKLTAEEFEVVKTHAAVGASILQNLPLSQDEPLIQVAYQICRWHHERYDGRGYPDGLVGDQIPITAQVVSLADVYDALTGERCYKKAYPHETAVRMIQNGECGVFNPLLIECLLDIQDQLRREISIPPEARNFSLAAQRISDHMVLEDDLPFENNLQYRLAYEREKQTFFALFAGGLQFDYNIRQDKASVSDYIADPVCENRTFTADALLRLYAVSPEDSRRLRDAAKQTTPESPDASISAAITVRGEKSLCRIAIRTLWSREPIRKMIGVVGYVVPIGEDHSAAPAFSLRMNNITGLRARTILHELQLYFDKVRLVNPVNHGVYKLNEDGSLKRCERPCYAIWGSEQVCRNCAGCKALSDKNRIVKLELTKTGIYQVIAKSVVVEGRPLVLELISRSDAGIWFDSHGKQVLLEKYGRDFYTDALTGAYCRQYFEDQRASLQGMDGVAMIDVDHFKEINDAYGHPVGDVALKKIVGAILSCIRSTDMLIRYGGDEFLAIFPQIQKDAFALKMRYIQDAVSRLSVDGYPDIRLSVSIGGVHRVEPLTEAIRQADQLMYRDKANKGVLRL